MDGSEEGTGAGWFDEMIRTSPDSVGGGVFLINWFRLVAAGPPDDFSDFELIQFIHAVGHPDEIAAARVVVGRPIHEDHAGLTFKHHLRRYEDAGREILVELKARGWKWYPGERHFKHQGGRGAPTYYVNHYIGAACAFLARTTRVDTEERARGTIRALLSETLDPGQLDDATLSSGISNWLRKTGRYKRRKRTGNNPPKES